MGIDIFKKKNAEYTQLVQQAGVINSLGLHYSIFVRPSSKAKYTLWYMHGLYDNETVPVQSLFNQDSLVEMEQAFGNDFPPTICISFGTQWMLTNNPNRTLIPQHAIVQNWPAIEASIATGLPKPYVLAGHSMGGHNAAMLLASYPQYFKTAALINPMLITCDPYNFIDLNCLAAPIVRMNVSSKQEWDTTNPLQLLQMTTLKLPPVYVTATPNDQFKLYPGAQTAYAIMSRKNSASVWESHDTDHYHFNGTAIAKWLMP